MKRKYPKKRLQAKAKELNKPLHLKPAAMEKYQASALLRAQHLAEQDMKHRKNEYNKLTHAIHSVQPSLRGDLVHQRSKLLK
jgi:hypothetical protein